MPRAWRRLQALIWLDKLSRARASCAFDREIAVGTFVMAIT
jgi:hypothetical protein